MGVYVKGNPKEGEYKLIKTTDGFVLEGKDIAYACIEIDLVRCGECKWCDDKGKGRALICTNPYIDMDIHPLDFCSYGERRTDDSNT